MVEPTDETKARIELEARDKRRLETFIDGVFAIAITLLGLGFVSPLLQHSSGALLVFYVSLWPKFLGYFLAFFLLAALLNNNWRQFQNIALADWPLFFINVLFLAFIVLVPLQQRYGLSTQTLPRGCCSSTALCSPQGSCCMETGGM